VIAAFEGQTNALAFRKTLFNAKIRIVVKQW
jgi:hypothetical protein